MCMDIHDIIRERHICPSAWAGSNLLLRGEEERKEKEERKEIPKIGGGDDKNVGRPQNGMCPTDLPMSKHFVNM